MSTTPPYWVMGPRGEDISDRFTWAAAADGSWTATNDTGGQITTGHSVLAAGDVLSFPPPAILGAGETQPRPITEALPQLRAHLLTVTGDPLDVTDQVTVDDQGRLRYLGTLGAYETVSISGNVRADR